MQNSPKPATNAVRDAKIIPTLPFFCIVFFVGGCVLSSRFSTETKPKTEPTTTIDSQYIQMSVENIKLRLLLKACEENTVLDSATLQIFNHYKF